MSLKINRILSAVLWLLLAISLPVFVCGQQAPTKAAALTSAVNIVSVEDHKLISKLMAREMPYRIFLPANYAAERKARFPVIYLLHGLTGHYDNWGSKTKIAEYLAPYGAIVVMPEGNDG